MKKFFVTVYLFVMALFVLTMSGCGGSGGGPQAVYNPNKPTTQSAQNRTMIFSSPALKRNGKYSIFRGDQVGVIGTNAKYYLAPVAKGSETITMNLEYTAAISQDLPFVITESDDSTVIFSYNPNGTVSQDTTTPYGSVLRYGGAAQKLRYSNLTLTGSSVELDDSDIVDIVLKSDGTATAGGSTIPVHDYVWKVDPQHPKEYWLKNGESTVLYVDSYDAAIETAGTLNGLYIAHDVRYTPDSLNFTTSNTAKKDEDTEYVVYYDFTSSAVRKELANVVATYGSGFSSDKYILATLPMQVNGMGGGTMPGGGMPSGDMPGEPPSGGMPSGDMPGQPPSFNSASDSSIAAVSTMTHSSTEAYNNPVLHITKAGTYRLSGTWKGQIWIEVGAKAQHQVGLILNGVNVECTVAPALVFYKVYKWAENGGKGYDTQSVLAANDLWKTLGSKMLSDDGYYDTGAVVEIADGTANTFTGANVYRLLELCPKLDDDDNPKYTGSGIGTDISEQEKMYKLDGAFHSRRSIVIGGGSAGTGTLNITSSTYEGLDSEMHMLIESGTVNVTAPDDGINVNEDYVSVFDMDGGTLTISSTGGDGIDSNGWVTVNGGTLNITAGTQSQNSAGEAGIDAENGVNISSNAKYNWSAASGSAGGGGTIPGGTTSGDQSGQQSGGQSGYSTIPVTPTTQTIGTDTTFTLFPTESSIQEDTEGTRNIPSSGNVFELVHRVNDFAGMTNN